MAIENNIFEQKYVNDGHALISITYSNGTESPVVRNNTLDNGSYLIWLQYNGADLLNTTVPVIEGNSGIGDADYGIYCEATSSGLMAPQILRNDMDSVGQGRGIYLARTAPATLVRSNNILGYSFGVYIYGAEAQIKENSITQLQDLSGTGHGIYVIYGSSTIIQANVIESFGIGIEAVSGYANPTSALSIIQNHIEGNSYGVSLNSTNLAYYDGPDATINNNDLVNNTVYDLFIGNYSDPDDRTIDATENWWGTVDPAQIQDRIYDHNDDPLSAYALVDPFLSSPIVFDDPAISLSPAEFQVELYPGTAGSDVLAISNNGLATLEYQIKEAVGDPGESLVAGPIPSSTVSAGPINQEGVEKRSDVPWLAVSPTAGSITGLGQQEILLNIIAPTEGGQYPGYLVIESNDLLHDLVVVPIALNVSAVFLQSPASGDTLFVNEIAGIEWNEWAGVGINSVDLHLSQDGGETYPYEIVAGYSGPPSYAWNVDAAVANNCLVRFTAHASDGEVYYDTSDEYFIICSGTICDIPVINELQHVNQLYQNCPNPFNPVTTIRFDLPERSRVDLRVFDVGGKEVRRLVDGVEYDSGEHSVIWNGHDMRDRVVPAGVYFSRIMTAGHVETKRMTLVK